MKYSLLPLLIASTLMAFSQQQNPDITVPELRQHVRYLSSDELKGRRAGEEGNRKAAEYIAEQFKACGLKPMGDDAFFQHFTFTSSVEAGLNNSLLVSTKSGQFTFELEKDIRPLAFSLDTTLSAPLVFAGYGITDTASQYDDYAGLDVKGKIVVVLRYSPAGKSGEGFSKHTPLRAKAFNAREHGAAGMILVTGPLDNDSAQLFPLAFDRGMGTSGIAAISMTWTSLNTLLEASGKSLKNLQNEINSSKRPQSFEFVGTTATLRTEVKKIISKSANILGFVEGSDPSLMDEVVVIGAHMDHLGYGGEGSLTPDTVAIHHGADDNASGTAALLEVAQLLASERKNLKRSVVCIAFSGEELGLLGSDFYVKNPIIPLEKTIAMLNMDMVGRVQDSILVVEGIGTSPIFTELVTRENTDPLLKLKLKQDGFGPSDHASFYVKDIPVLFFFTNLHPDYHKPSDTWEKINYDGTEKVAELVARIAVTLATLTERPGFTRAQTTSMHGDRGEVRVSLGVIPDYADDVAGLKISGTRPGSAAEKAGLKGNDVIVKFGGKDIKNIYDFMAMLGDYKPGDTVPIVVKRGIDEVTLSATLQAR